MQITSGRIPGALKVCVYGPEGIGKTTFAAQFPEPLFIDTEGSTVHMDVRRMPKPDSWSELLGEVEYIRLNAHLCKTLVVDTVDWAEALCCEHICARDQQPGIEGYGYGKGYKFAQEEFGRLLNALETVRAKGVHIVLCCHAALRKFEQPDEMGAYDRWGMKLIDAPRSSIAGMVKEWCDMVLFANYKTIVVNVDGKGAAKGKNKVQGGKRVMYTAHNPCWDAKNRFGLPEEADFSYEVIRGIVEGSGAAPTTAAPAANTPPAPVQARPQPVTAPTTATATAPAATPPEPSNAAATPVAAAVQAQPRAQPEPEQTADPFADIPDSVAKLMREADVTPDEVRAVIHQRTGVYTVSTPWSVICKDTNFVNGWLLHPNVWPKVVDTVRAMRTETPF